jgi:hypothetical protein
MVRQRLSQLSQEDLPVCLGSVPWCLPLLCACR